MKKFFSQIVIGVVFLIFGFMIVIQLKSVNAQNATAGVDGNSQNPEILLENEQLKKEREELMEKVKELSDKAAEYEASAAGKGENQILIDDLQKTRLRAGLTDVKGEGIIVYITPKTNPFGTTTSGYPIKDFDLLIMVNELYANGAEAISINDIRLIGNTGIRSAGNAIMINSTRISPLEQVVIKAIGSKSVLTGTMEFPGTISSDLHLYCDVTYKAEDELIISKSNAAIDFKYIQENKEE